MAQECYGDLWLLTHKPLSLVVPVPRTFLLNVNKHGRRQYVSGAFIEIDQLLCCNRVSNKRSAVLLSLAPIMATRSLTEVFILMRNNALQNRHIFSDQISDDHTALVSHDEEIAMMMSHNSQLPPEWVDGVEEIQFEISRIKEKMRELHGLHDKHLNRPTLDDSVDEEHAIDILTQEITHMFMRSQHLVQQINNKSHLGSSQEQKLTMNIVSSLARTLQEMSTNFRKAQSGYLRKLRTREERSNQYFGTDLMPVDSQTVDDIDEIYERGFSQVQLQAVEENTFMVEQREREISQIVKSIQELNDIFKDLATLIVDQGTLLDRIDYNIEQTAVKVDKGLKQLQKAEKYQKKNRKMLIILVLFAIVIIMVAVLIFVKS